MGRKPRRLSQCVRENTGTETASVEVHRPVRVYTVEKGGQSDLRVVRDWRESRRRILIIILI